MACKVYFYQHVIVDIYLKCGTIYSKLSCCFYKFYLALKIVILNMAMVAQKVYFLRHHCCFKLRENIIQPLLLRHVIFIYFYKVLTFARNPL